VAIGAHPGYPDRDGFGRRDLAMTADELEASVLYQLGALAAFVRAAGLQLRHVKPHGAMYNRAARDAELSAAICRAVRRFDPSLVIVGLAGSVLIETASANGLAVAAEAFADRAYEADGGLRSRLLPGAILPTPEAAAEQALSIVTLGNVTRHDGQLLRLAADTLCVHGDTPGAPEYVRQIRQRLEGAGVTVAPFVLPA
jgi:UPF0271 protein